MMKNGFLDQIIARKKTEIEDARKRISERQLRDDASRPRRKRPFHAALAKPGPSDINIIAEIKRASPSKGIIRADLDPAKYAEAYEKGGAAAISVLTDNSFFQGSMDDLHAARAASTLPILRKDFLISDYQIYESAALLEADAVLLIVRALSQRQLADYLALCGELDLDALVEVFSETDLETAVLAGAKLIGINNRNLGTFETDNNRAVRMISMLEPWQTGIAASGIADRADIETGHKAGLFNFLIGESIVRAENPMEFLKELLHA